MKRIKAFFTAAVALCAGLLEKYMSEAGLVAFLNLYSQFTYDNALLLKAAALVGASANGTLILDLGNGVHDAFVVIDITALEAATDESYEIVAQGSPDATFGTAGNIVALGSVTLGHPGSARAIALGQGTTDGIGRVAFPIRNEKNGITYRYMRLRTVVVGTIATGINYSAFLAKR